MDIQKQFNKAIKENDIQSVKSLINKDRVDPSFDNNSPLLFCCDKGYTEIFELLINDKRVNPADNTYFDGFFMEVVCQKGHFDIAKLLLNDERIDPSISNNHIIHTAYVNEHFDIVKLLWNDQRVKNKLAKSNFSLYKELIQQDIEEKENKNVALSVEEELIKAVNEENFKKIQKFLDFHYLNINSEKIDSSFYNLLFQNAASNGKLETIKFIVNNEKINYSINYNLAILNSAEQGHHEVVEFLINVPKYIYERNDNSCIIESSSNGYINVLKILLNDNRFSPSMDDNLAIKQAICNGHFDIVKLLLNDKRVNPADSTSFEVAFKEEYMDIVNFLWQDERVRKDLKINNKELYNRLSLEKNIKSF
tara:strand:- start:535 stop:1629 length:1095 start_codon:yes stop_codon:yes gene_type:complete